MCGITGIINLNRAPVPKALINKMTSVLSHRGPDDEGYLLANTDTGQYLTAGGEDTPQAVFPSNFRYSPKTLLQEAANNDYNLALGHRRLSIIDLSPAGHQPMCNENGTLWIVHNGEIYNYLEIRDELKLKGYSFHSDSDTEVIINAYEEWGPDCLSKFNGMWAFCIWDSRKKELFCARDRLGIKPFYYYFDGQRFAFASEIKSLLQMEINSESNGALIYDYLKYGILDHTDDTFIKNIKKLPAAHFLRIDISGKLYMEQYWDLAVSDRVGNGDNDKNIAEDFYHLFEDAVRIRLRSDVPIGSCLSGGLDSSSIVVVANKLMYPVDNVSAGERQKTISACYDDKNSDEREYIEEIIKYTKAESNYVFPTANGLLNNLDKIIWHQEEPVSGTGIYAQWEVMRKAKESGVTVLLDGQGADEQLAGYMKFYIFYIMQLFRNGMWFRTARELLPFLVKSGRISNFDLRNSLRYFKFGTKFLNADSLLNQPFKSQFNDRRPEFGYAGNLGKRIKDDLVKYSLPVLLRYEDKNSMSHAVETRLPFLDYRLVEMLASLPLNQKMSKGWTKYVLRNAMKGVLPEKIRLRKTKFGFNTPEELWVRTIIVKELAKINDKPSFIDEYINIKLLRNHIDDYLAHRPTLDNNMLFRIHILERWGQQYIS